MEQRVVGAIKIKDGVYIGDHSCASDLEFLVANKITYIINAAASQLP
jgi:hypothetical protein